MQVFTAEKLFTSLFVAFAAFVVWQSHSFGIFSSTITGPGFFPAIAGAIMLASAGISLVSKKRAGKGDAVDDPQSGDAAESGNRVELFRVTLLVCLTALFIVLAPYVGMIALTPFYVFACFLVLTPDFQPTRLGIGVLTAIFFTLLAWAIFDRALGVPMPRGPF